VACIVLGAGRAYAHQQIGQTPPALVLLSDACGSVERMLLRGLSGLGRRLGMIVAGRRAGLCRYGLLDHRPFIREGAGHTVRAVVLLRRLRAGDHNGRGLGLRVWRGWRLDGLTVGDDLRGVLNVVGKTRDGDGASVNLVPQCQCAIRMESNG
jgi:hypothetical protein